MNNTFKDIVKKQKVAQTVVDNCNTALKALRDICEHKWDCQGHGHNDNLYVCLECGKEEWR
jgi:hypothetical protein